MHMDRATTVMVGRMVVWMRVSQRSADGGALDGQRQQNSDGLSGHGHIVGERGHLVKTYGRPPRRSWLMAITGTEPHAASFLNDPALVGGRAARDVLPAEKGGRN